MLLLNVSLDWCGLLVLLRGDLVVSECGFGCCG